MVGVSDIASTLLSKAGTKGYYRELHPRERLQAVKDVAQFATTVVALSYLGAIAYGGTVDTDPFSSTFMDVKLPNGKSFNLTGGFSSYIRNIFQFAAGRRDEDGQAKTTNRLDIAGRFFRGKTPPITSAGINAAAGKDFMGKPTTLASQAENVLLPISAQGIVQEIRRDGVLSLFTEGIPTFLGFNIKDARDYQNANPLSNTPVGKEAERVGVDLSTLVLKDKTNPDKKDETYNYSTIGDPAFQMAGQNITLPPEDKAKYESILVDIVEKAINLRIQDDDYRKADKAEQSRILKSIIEKSKDDAKYEFEDKNEKYQLVEPFNQKKETSDSTTDNVMDKVYQIRNPKK